MSKNTEYNIFAQVFHLFFIEFWSSVLKSGSHAFIRFAETLHKLLARGLYCRLVFAATVTAELSLSKS
jgi:hypothetical protein